MVEDQGLHFFNPHVSLIAIPVTALESGKVVANPSCKSIHENKV